MIPIYFVDAFAEKTFEGNPAAVCLLNEERPTSWMISVAAEINLPETAFIRTVENSFEIRWFTPTVEVDLCGHATLAAAHVLWTNGIVADRKPILFQTKSGFLKCEQSGEFIEMDFPSIPVTPAEAPPGLIDALHAQPAFIGQTKFDSFLLLDSEDILRAMQPDFASLGMITGMRGVIVTSGSTDPRFDFISRFFAPAVGVNEDPATGSSHCSLAPFWSARLGKFAMIGFQASRRSAIVRVRVNGNRTILAGKAITVLRGELL